MKFSLLALLPAVLAAPADVSTRETKQQATDRYIFSNTLPAFLQARAKQPDGLDWSSDGCSSASDNPFGFPFLPACQRHDFGYRNYKAQSRFSSANRKKIDEKFLEDMNYQCEKVNAKSSCRATVRVYYTGVRMFGGMARKREAEAEFVDESPEELIVAYHEAVEAQRKAFAEDIAAGLLTQPEQEVTVDN